MSSLNKKPTKRKPPYYFYEGKGWKIETKVKINDRFVKLNHGWYRTWQEAATDYQNQVNRLSEKSLPPKYKPNKDVSWEELRERFFDYRRTQVRGSSLQVDRTRLHSLFDPLFCGLKACQCFKREKAAEFQSSVLTWGANRKNKNKALSYYLKMLEYAFDHEYLEEDTDYRKCKSEISLIRSTEEEETVKEKQVLTSEQLERLYEAIEDAKDKMLTALMANTGLRIGEALACRFSDFDFDAGQLFVSRTVAKDEFGQSKEYNRTKTKLGQRTIPLPKDFLAIIMSYCQAFDIKGTDFLFPSDENKQRFMDGSAYRVRLNAYCRNAGVPRITPHSIRHTFATLLSQRCRTDAERIARAYIMGHSVTVDEETYAAHNQLETARKLLN